MTDGRRKISRPLPTRRETVFRDPNAESPGCLNLNQLKVQISHTVFFPLSFARGCMDTRMSVKNCTRVQAHGHINRKSDMHVNIDVLKCTNALYVCTTQIERAPHLCFTSMASITDFRTRLDCLQAAHDQSRGVHGGAIGRALPGPGARPREFAPILRLHGAGYSEVYRPLGTCRHT